MGQSTWSYLVWPALEECSDSCSGVSSIVSDEENISASLAQHVHKHCTVYFLSLFPGSCGPGDTVLVSGFYMWCLKICSAGLTRHNDRPDGAELNWGPQLQQSVSELSFNHSQLWLKQQWLACLHSQEFLSLKSLGWSCSGLDINAVARPNSHSSPFSHWCSRQVMLQSLLYIDKNRVLTGLGWFCSDDWLSTMLQNTATQDLKQKMFLET